MIFEDLSSDDLVSKKLKIVKSGNSFRFQIEFKNNKQFIDLTKEQVQKLILDLSIVSIKKH